MESQRKAGHARNSGHFGKSVVPMKDILDHDEHMRPASALESLAELKPAFEGFGRAGFEAVAKARYPEIEELKDVRGSS